MEILLKEFRNFWLWKYSTAMLIFLRNSTEMIYRLYYLKTYSRMANVSFEKYTKELQKYYSKSLYATKQLFQNKLLVE